MSQEQKNNPLHGVKLINILEYLIENYGFDHLSTQLDINCFKKNPTLKSCLKFLRKTPWARTKVEEIYLKYTQKK